MNTQRNAAHRLEEDIANAEVPPRSDQVPLLEECENDDQASVNTPPLTHENMRIPLLQMDQAITTPDQEDTNQSQANDSRKSGGYAPSSSISNYYCFPSIGLHSNVPYYFLWV